MKSLLLNLFLFTSAMFSQPSLNVRWQKIINHWENQSIQHLLSTSDNGYILASTIKFGNLSEDELIRKRKLVIDKLDYQGSIQWRKSIGGNKTDVIRDIHQNKDSSYVLAGFSYSNIGDFSRNRGNRDLWIVKLTGAGDIEWQKLYGGSSEDEARSIKQTSDGGYIVAGYTYSNDGDVARNRGNSDIWILRLDSSGQILWNKTFGGQEQDFAYFIKETIDGGFIIAGTGNTGDDNEKTHEFDSLILKLDQNGNLEWQQYLGNIANDVAQMVIPTEDFGYIAVGYSMPKDGKINNNSESVSWVVKLDSSGTVKWKNTFGETGYSEAQTIQTCSDGGFIITGLSSEMKINDIDIKGGISDFKVMKLDSEGSLKWEKIITNNGFCEKYTLRDLGSDRYIITLFDNESININKNKKTGKHYSLMQEKSR